MLLVMLKKIVLASNNMQATTDLHSTETYKVLNGLIEDNKEKNLEEVMDYTIKTMEQVHVLFGNYIEAFFSVSEEFYEHLNSEDFKERVNSRSRANTIYQAMVDLIRISREKNGGLKKTLEELNDSPEKSIKELESTIRKHAVHLGMAESFMKDQLVTVCKKYEISCETASVFSKS